MSAITARYVIKRHQVPATLISSSSCHSFFSTETLNIFTSLYSHLSYRCSIHAYFILLHVITGSDICFLSMIRFEWETLYALQTNIRLFPCDWKCFEYVYLVQSLDPFLQLSKSTSLNHWYPASVSPGWIRICVLLVCSLLYRRKTALFEILGWKKDLFSMRFSSSQ